MFLFGCALRVFGWVCELVALSDWLTFWFADGLLVVGVCCGFSWGLSLVCGWVWLVTGFGGFY